MKIIGAAIALAGVEKLARERGYLRMFEHLGWSKSAMRALAGAEALGGVLMMFEATKRVGGALVAGASVTLLTSEIRHGDGALAAPRGMVMLAGAYALFAQASGSES